MNIRDSLTCVVRWTLDILRTDWRLAGHIRCVSGYLEMYSLSSHNIGRLRGEYFSYKKCNKIQTLLLTLVQLFYFPQRYRTPTTQWCSLLGWIVDVRVGLATILFDNRYRLRMLRLSVIHTRYALNVVFDMLFGIYHVHRLVCDHLVRLNMHNKFKHF